MDQENNYEPKHAAKILKLDIFKDLIKYIIIHLSMQFWTIVKLWQKHQNVADVIHVAYTFNRVFTFIFLYSGAVSEGTHPAVRPYI